MRRSSAPSFKKPEIEDNFLNKRNSGDSSQENLPKRSKSIYKSLKGMDCNSEEEFNRVPLKDMNFINSSFSDIRLSSSSCFNNSVLTAANKLIITEKIKKPFSVHLKLFIKASFFFKR